MTTPLGPPPFTGMLGTALSLKSRVILAYHGPSPAPPIPPIPRPPIQLPPTRTPSGGGIGPGAFQPPLVCPPCGSPMWRDPRCPKCPPDLPEAEPPAARVRIEPEPDKAEPKPEPSKEEEDTEAEEPAERVRVSTAGNEEAKNEEQKRILLEQTEVLRDIASRVSQVADHTKPEPSPSPKRARREKVDEETAARWFATLPSAQAQAQSQPLPPLAPWVAPRTSDWLVPVLVTVGILGTVFGVAMLIDSMTERSKTERNPTPPSAPVRRRKSRRKRKPSRTRR
jgi:hypothetical protein